MGSYRIFRDYTPTYICCKTLSNNSYKSFQNLHIKNNLSYKYYSQLSCINNNKISNDKFSYYLTGLIEGDGTIVVPKTKTTKGRLNYPSIQIIFNLKDLPLALLIQKELGNGSLSRKRGVNAYTLTVNSQKGLLLLISLINGKMRTPKIHSLNALIDWYNSKDSSLNINKKSVDKSIITSNAWLSGFIEADGHFSVRTTTVSKTYPRIECKFELSQRQIDHKGCDNIDFLNDISEFLSTETKKVRVSRPNPEYRVRTVSLKGNINLENYLNNFPLFGSKYLDYFDWLKVLNLFKKGKFDHKSNMEDVKKIKLNMNDRRTVYTWNHLDNFYKLDI